MILPDQNPPRPQFVYVATPYSHADPEVMESRYRAAIVAAAHFMAQGFIAFSPIAHSHEIGKHIGKTAGGHADNGVHNFWMHQDLPMLARADALFVLTLDGWKESRGVAEEVEFAVRNGIPVYHVEPASIAALNIDVLPDIPHAPGASDAVPEDGKATNPKDVVGTRKAPMSTVPAGVVAEIGVGMLEGAVKGYGRHNYRVAGIRASVYYDAAMRHLMAWWEGEDIDPDSGVSHVAKALCTLVVLRDGMMQEFWTDDRAPRARPFYPELNERAAALVDKYADREPRHYTIADTLPLRPEVL